MADRTTGRPRPILFLTDFGYEDEFTGVCRAVIDRVTPEVKVIDLTHGIDPGEIRRGALALAAAVAYSAPAVLLAVVDPGVGTDRRAVALQAGPHHLVGPDNGLLWLAAQAAGGADRAWDISQSPARLEGTRRTFHGRDIFSPVAARLALGEDPDALGAEFDVEGLVRLELPQARVEEDLIEATVLAADRYGNLALNLGSELIAKSFLRPGGKVRIQAGGPAGPELADTVTFADAFGEVDAGEALLYPDSSGALSLAVNRGDAAAAFSLGPDDQIQLRPA